MKRLLVELETYGFEHWTDEQAVSFMNELFLELEDEDIQIVRLITKEETQPK